MFTVHSLPAAAHRQRTPKSENISCDWIPKTKQWGNRQLNLRVQTNNYACGYDSHIFTERLESYFCCLSNDVIDIPTHNAKHKTRKAPSVAATTNKYWHPACRDQVLWARASELLFGTKKSTLTYFRQHKERRLSSQHVFTFVCGFVFFV